MAAANVGDPVPAKAVSFKRLSEAQMQRMLVNPNAVSRRHLCDSHSVVCLDQGLAQESAALEDRLSAVFPISARLLPLQTSSKLVQIAATFAASTVSASA
jgi:hypothetical protein